MPKATKSKKKSPAKAAKVGKWNIWTPKSFVVIAVFVAFAVVGVHFLNTSHASTPCVYRTFNYTTSYDVCVTKIQNMIDGLNVCKYNNCAYGGIYTTPDGYYGSGTKQTVKDYQDAYNKKLGRYVLTIDGITGKNTWTALCYPPTSWLPSDTSPTYRQYHNARYEAGCGYL